MGATVRKITQTGGEERIVIRTRFTFDPGIRVSEARVAKIAAEQRRSFDARFPQLDGLPFEFSWAGRLCLSLNHVPAFGEVEEDLFSACCENGLGTVKSTLAGRPGRRTRHRHPLASCWTRYQAQPAQAAAAGAARLRRHQFGHPVAGIRAGREG